MKNVHDVISVHNNLLPKQHASKFLQCFDNAQNLLLSSCVRFLGNIECSAAECKGLAFLHDHCTQLVITGISMDVEFFTEIREGQPSWLMTLFISLKAA